MPHRRSLLLAARRFAVGALPLSVAACAGEGRVTVVVDTTGSGGALEVLALPVNPAAIELPPEILDTEPPGSPRGDSIVRFLALRDSIAALDERFQRERASLNAEAARFDSLDRTSAAYARAWDAHRARLVDAERLRTTRDRLRERAASLAARLGDAVPPDDSTRRAAVRTAWREVLDAASDGERRTVHADVRVGAATLALEPGQWWIGAAARGDVPASFVPADVTAGMRDTLRVRP